MKSIARIVTFEQFSIRMAITFGPRSRNVLFSITTSWQSRRLIAAETGRLPNSTDHDGTRGVGTAIGVPAVAGPCVAAIRAGAAGATAGASTAWAASMTAATSGTEVSAAAI